MRLFPREEHRGISAGIDALGDRLELPRNLPDARSLLLIRPWLKSARPLLRGACGVVTVGLIQARRHELARYRGAGAVAI